MLKKNTQLTCLLISLVSLLLFNSCEEVIQNLEPCDFNYGGLAFTKGPANQVQEITPNFSQRSGTGTFSSSPAGLEIDPETGVIDVNASDPGEYTITHEDQTTCETRILIQEGEQECSLSYGTNVIAPGEKQLLLARVNDEKISGGKFYAEPSGLRLNSTNGVIDVGASESGVKYTIFYESAEEKVFCQTQLTISGINYKDTALNFDTIDANIVEISPVYVDVENENLPAPEGKYFAIGENAQSLDLEGTDGTIDLKSTLRLIQEIEFGGDRPDSINSLFTIQYELEQEEIASSIQIQLLWYPSVEEIPEDIKEIMEGREIIIENGKIEKRPPYILTVGDYE